VEIINYSGEPENKVIGWLPAGLKPEKIIFFPDACPAKSTLPTGTVVFTTQENWRGFAVSDCGCGMLLMRSCCNTNDFKKSDWDKIYFDLRANKGKKGDLGSGNHFLIAIQSVADNYIYFLIHTGSRNESGIVDRLVHKQAEFDQAYANACAWAEENRFSVSKTIARYFGDLVTIVDRSHNNIDALHNGIIIRKGAVRIKPGQLSVIPSSLDGEAVLVRATDKVSASLYSLNHGTGRVMSRSEAKLHTIDYDYESLRQRVYIPDMIRNASIRTEVPLCYRQLNDCLTLIKDLIIIEDRFKSIAYLGQI
jgi:RNA-splicing ligase RtcB